MIFGVISMGDPEPETPEVVTDRIHAALEHLPPERLMPVPDFGMKCIPRATPSPSSRHWPRVPRSSATS